MPRANVQPVRSRRGEGAFEEGGAGEAGGRDGSLLVIDEILESPNLARDLAAGILSAEAEEEGNAAARAAQGTDDRGDQGSVKGESAEKAPAAPARSDEQAVPARDRDDRSDGHRPGQGTPQAEDTTLAELRHAFSSGRHDNNLVLGI